MAHKTPLVEGIFLVDPGSTIPRIVVGSADWYRWLASASSFAVAGEGGRYTARKDRPGPSGGYWRAYRKVHGKLASVYLGRSAELSLERLQRAAAELGLELGAATTPDETPSRQPAPGRSSSAHTLTFLIADGDLRRAPERAAKQSGEVSRWVLFFAGALDASRGDRFTPAPGVLGGAFGDVLDAIAAAASAQHTLLAAIGAGQLSLMPRMALHTGVAARQHGTYVGQPVDTCLQLLASAHPSQILLSQITHALVKSHLHAGLRTRDLGAYWVGNRHQPEHIFQLQAADLPAVDLPLRPPAHRPHNLPTPAMPLIGRAGELAAVVATLQRGDVRLLTLTGAGGVGKTRLALQAAAELRDSFADGVFLIDLGPIRDPDTVLRAIAQALGVNETGQASLQNSLRSYLAARQLLLLLDNFEQVLPAAASLAVLLAAAPRLALLVTSRAALRLSGEHELALAPLDLPAPGAALSAEELAGYGAVSLFFQRAQAVRKDLAPTPEILVILAEICRRLDGLPLAIELAAARCRLFPPAALLGRLERRLPVLTGGAHDLPARQQTMRDTIDWSYQLLPAEHQRTLHQLAVFVGGFTLEAAQAVCGAGADALLEALGVLIDQSLINAGANGPGGLRFLMLETIGEYALERLQASGQEAPARERHAAYYLRLAERLEPTLQGETLRAALDELDAELLNLRAALAWDLSRGQPERALRLAAALRELWDVRAHRSEGRSWLIRALGAAVVPAPAARARALHVAGHLARALSDEASALVLLEESLAIYRALDNRAGIAAVTVDLGVSLAWLGGDRQRAETLLAEGIGLAREQGDLYSVAWALQGLGWLEEQRALGYRPGSWAVRVGLSWVVRDPALLTRARALHAESLAVRRAAGDIHGVAWSLTCLGTIAYDMRTYDLARSYQEERLTIERSLNNLHGIANAMQQLGTIALRQGDTATARIWLEQSLAIARTTADMQAIGFVLLGLGEIALSTGEIARAGALLSEAHDCFHTVGDSYRAARASSLLAQVALARHEGVVARQQAADCLQQARALDDEGLLCNLLMSMGDGAARTGAALWAARLWGAAEGRADAARLVRLPAASLGHDQLVAAARQALGPQPFARAWQEGRQQTPEAALGGEDGAPPAPPEHGLPPLTRREREVLALLVEGLSNAQIAARLVISPATVKTYLSAIYDKIGVRSRTAAVRYANEHRL